MDVRRFHWTSPAVFTGADDFGVFRFNNNLPGGTGNPLANFLLGRRRPPPTRRRPGPTSTARLALRLLLPGRVARQQHGHAEPGPALRPASRLQGRGAQHHQLPARHAQWRRGRAERGVAWSWPSPPSPPGSAPSRILTADEAGLPESLRNTDNNNFSPRIGVAWRPFGDNRTVLRAGYGLYTGRILGAVFNSLTGIHTSDNQTFDNTFDPATRTFGFVFPNTLRGQREPRRDARWATRTSRPPTTRTSRTRGPSSGASASTARSDRDNALRFTYSGRHDSNLTLAPDLNEIQPNTVGFANLPRTARPFPNWCRVNTRDNGGDANYHDLTFQFTGRLQKAGLNYTSSYKWAKGISTSKSAAHRLGEFPDRRSTAAPTIASTRVTCAARSRPSRTTAS